MADLCVCVLSAHPVRTRGSPWHGSCLCRRGVCFLAESVTSNLPCPLTWMSGSWGTRGGSGWGDRSWEELGKGDTPLLAFPPGVQILSTATSPRHLVERTRSRRCPSNAGMPSNKSEARVTCPEWTNQRALPEAGQPGPKSASLHPPSRARGWELITVIAVGELRRAGAGAGGWAGPRSRGGGAGK